MSSYLDRGLIGHDAFRHSGMFWFDVATNMWIPVDTLHPIPVDVNGVQIAGYSPIYGAIKTLEQAWPEYDQEAGEFRVSAVLPAAGAYDAAPNEIPTLGYKICTVWWSYTRGAAGGSFAFYFQRAQTIAGVDTWGRMVEVRPGVFAPGADVRDDAQLGAWENFVSQGAAAEMPMYEFDISRCTKFRIPAAETSGLAVGTLRGTYLLSNE